MNHETQRIIDYGGRVEQFKDMYGNCLGPLRVWIKNENIPGLAMTRSFGDKVAESVGVISVPDVKEHWLDQNDKIIILASDGVWEFISNEECI